MQFITALFVFLLSTGVAVAGDNIASVFDEVYRRENIPKSRYKGKFTEKILYKTVSKAKNGRYSDLYHFFSKEKLLVFVNGIESDSELQLLFFSAKHNEIMITYTIGKEQFVGFKKVTDEDILTLEKYPAK